jgi:uncharacterized phage-associated protein
VEAFDQAKFEELVLYIAWVTRDDERFGRTKFAKALFYTDFNAYAEAGAAITWAEYRHWQHGPFPPVLYAVTDDLERRGLVNVLRSNAVGAEDRVVAVAEPPARLLEEYQRTLARLSADRVAADPSWRVSDLSHEHPGWVLTDMGEPIPYTTAYIGTQRPPREAVEEGRRLRDEHKWP